MKKITLAYHEINQPQVDELQSAMRNTGLEFEALKITDSDTPGQFASQLEGLRGEILMLYSGDLFRSEAAMTNYLSALQMTIGKNQVLQVLAPGTSEEGSGLEETRLDRMSDLIHYMNHWQNRYLEFIETDRKLSADEREQAKERMDRVHHIANEIGEVLNTVRDSLYFSWDQVKANNFKLFLQQFDLSSLQESVLDSVEKSEPKPALPAPEEPAPKTEEKEDEETPQGLATPSGPVMFQPISPKQEDEPDEVEEPADEESEEQVQNTEILSVEEDGEALYDDEEIRKTIRDAWEWIENGDVDRGLKVFQLAIEQYPNHEQLRTEYLLALSRNSRSPEMAERQLEILHDSGIEEAKSYDLMGEIALSKGDYHFAKYCWERVLNLDPGKKGIYKKLALVTGQNLPEHRDLAIDYLHKALEEEPENTQLTTLLNEYREAPSSVESEAPDQPEVPETPEKSPEVSDQAEEPTVIPESPVQEEEKVIEQPEEPLEAGPQQLVLITGATSGIGLACARVFAREGYRLVLTGRRSNKLDQIKEELQEKYNVQIITRSFDVRQQHAVEHALNSLPEGWDVPDILINNAGLAKGLDPIHRGKIEHWETMIDTNVKGLLYVTRLLSPGMVERKSGHIINVGSSAGKEVYPNGNVYCATKFAVDALTRAIRIDLHAYNIRVSQVSPGHVEETEFALNRFDGDSNKARIYEDFQPLKSSDVAEGVLFIVTRPPHVNIQDLHMFGTQQANSTTIDRSGRV